jgi:hypothetical protein
VSRLRVGGLHLFSGETDKCLQWLESRAATDKHQQLGKSPGVDDEGAHGIWSTPPWPTGWT